MKAAQIDDSNKVIDWMPQPPKVDAFDGDGRTRKQSDVLVDIALTHELFHSPDRDAYARVETAVYLVDSADYRERLAREYLELAGRGANRNSIADAICTITSLAKFRGKCHPVYLRVARLDDPSGHLHSIMIDMCGNQSRVIEVDRNGWRWAVSPPMFRRVRSMRPLPEPKEPDFSRIWRYLNVRDADKSLVAAFILAAFRQSGPHPILALNGEQGTGKSTFSRVKRRLIDPTTAPLRSPPKDVRDLLVGALNGWVLALDNLSFLGAQLSDALCRISTGGAISERALYSNTDEVLIQVQRPVIINGIEDLTSRPDLAERSLHIELEMISDSRRMSEEEFWRSFERDAPHIFGGILAGLTASIRNHGSIKMTKLPRMADFALWAAAGMPELGFTVHEFESSYRQNQHLGIGAGVDGSPVGRAILAFMDERRTWKGTATELLSELNRRVGDGEIRSRAWPQSPRGLSSTITRLAPAFRLHGIDVQKDRSTDAGRDRLLTLCKRPEQPSEPSEPSEAAPASDDLDDLDDHSGELHGTAEVF